MADKYHRIVSFLINLCPEPLRELLLQKAMADTKPGTPYTTLDAYLAFRNPDILSLQRTRKLRKDQYDLLYNSGPVDVSKWDITLLALLILELFPTNITYQVEFYIRDIRDVRNSLQHESTTSSISDSIFQQNWDRLEIATLALAKVVKGTNYESVMKGKIETAKVSNLPDLANTLTSWFMEVKTQMMAEMTEINEKMKEMSDEVKESKAKAIESANILQKSCMVKPGRTGKPNKRMKIVDKKLKKMQDNFERTMNTEIPEDFNAPNETDRIKEKLRDNQLALVAGQNKSLYVAAALTAVKDMGYNEKCCVEMQSPSDWTHVDPEDVEFVLCCNPFGGEVYDEEKARCMAGVFNSIQQTVEEDRDDKKLAVLIVTDIGVLNECKEKYNHDILEEVVTVYNSTSANQPADVTGARCTNDGVQSISAGTQTLMSHTLIFLKHYEIASKQVDPETMKEAKAKFKVHKATVLIGSPGSGKTSMAVALAASYQPSKVLLLTYPEQIQYIDHRITHLVIIEDFAGKYIFDKNQALRWYNSFDLLFFMKSAGILNIIITCDKQKLEQCFEEIAAHPLLENTMELFCPGVVVKQEITNTCFNQTQPLTEETVSQQDVPYSPERGNPSSLSATRFTSIANMNEIICLKNIFGGENIYIHCICLTKNKSIYVAVQYSGRECLLYRDKNINIKYSVKNYIYQMCCINDGCVVTVSNPTYPIMPTISVLQISDGSAMVIKTVQIKNNGAVCADVSCNDEEQILTLWNDGKIYMHNIYLENIRQFKYTEPEVAYPYLDSIITSKGHIFIRTAKEMLYENFMIGCRGASVHDYLLSSCICAATADPFTVFVKDRISNKLFQYNKNCQKISEIPLTVSDQSISCMVFDETSSRLIISDNKSVMIYELYLK